MRGYFTAVVFLSLLHQITACTELTAEGYPQFMTSHADYGETEYPSNMNECFRIYADDSTYGSGSTIQIRNDAFNLENDCDFDYVTIYDGYDSSSATLHYRICGSGSDFTYSTSSGNYLYIEMISDYTVQEDGFLFSYAVYGNGISSFPTTAPPDVLSYDIDCTLLSSVTSTYWQSLVSHAEYGSQQYGSNLDTCWVICAPDESDTVSLRFVSFDLESTSSGQCNYDKVTIYEGTSDSASTRGEYCGDGPSGTIVSSGQCSALYFTTDSSFEDDGFHLYYRTSTEDDEDTAGSGNTGGNDDGSTSSSGLSFGSLIGIIVFVVIAFVGCVSVVPICICFTTGNKGRVNHHGRHNARISMIAHQTASYQPPPPYSQATRPQNLQPGNMVHHPTIRVGAPVHQQQPFQPTAPAAPPPVYPPPPPPAAAVVQDPAYPPPSYDGR